MRGHHLSQAKLAQDVAALGDECVKRRALLHKAGARNIWHKREPFSGDLCVRRLIHLPYTRYRPQGENAWTKFLANFPFRVVEFEKNDARQIC